MPDEVLAADLRRSDCGARDAGSRQEDTPEGPASAEWAFAGGTRRGWKRVG